MIHCYCHWDANGNLHVIYILWFPLFPDQITCIIQTPLFWDCLKFYPKWSAIKCLSLYVKETKQYFTHDHSNN